jgi:hypothetical protein
MKQKWIANRQAEQRADGQHRWDVAYQCLLRWTRAAICEDILIQSHQEEVCYESSNLRSGVDAAASSSPDH